MGPEGVGRLVEAMLINNLENSITPQAIVAVLTSLTKYCQVVPSC
jgi:hypothetical protein